MLCFKALTASGLSGLRWTLAQILTQKQELGNVYIPSPDVQKMDSAIHGINHYPVDKY